VPISRSGFRSWSASFSAAATSRPRSFQQRIESFIVYFDATMAKPFRWTMKGRPLVAPERESKAGPWRDEGKPKRVRTSREVY
jgi:hypothetical protein